MGKEVVQGILVGIAFVLLFVSAGNYVGANLSHGGGHGGGHGEAKKHDTVDEGKSSKKNEKAQDGEKGAHGAKEHDGSKGHDSGSTGWGSYLLGLILHVLWLGIPSFIIFGFVALSEYFDRSGIDWWKAYVPGYNVWAFATGGSSES